ncbi:MAG TPA: enoyl-CoA hydratase/isomerase family protein, partial [Bacillota bacterium]
MTTYETLRVEDQGGIRTIILNRPDRLNALDPVMKRELPACLQEAIADANVRALVLTGAGRGFCSGADLGAMTADRGPAGVRYMRDLQEGTVGRMLASP